MKGLTYVAMLLFCGVAYSQTAKVVQLSPVDVVEIKSLYAQRDEIEKKIADFKTKVEHQYISDEVTYPSTACITFETMGSCAPPKPTPAQEKASHHWQLKDGWTSGFEYSEGFKFIVPLPRPVFSTIAPGCFTSPYITSPVISW